MTALTRKQKIEAAREAQYCACCGEPFGEGDVIYRRRLNIGRAMMGLTDSCIVAPACEKHAVLDWRRYRRAVPCAGCDRPVRDLHYRRIVTCSDRCAARVVCLEARARRAENRGTLVCPVCNETFEPTRTDAKFCSGACRQRAYRHRVTDNNSVAAETIDSRNVTAKGAESGVPAISRNGAGAQP
jgi:hypothetical protein